MMYSRLASLVKHTDITLIHLCMKTTHVCYLPVNYVIEPKRQNYIHLYQPYRPGKGEELQDK